LPDAVAATVMAPRFWSEPWTTAYGTTTKR
jgi:hypothetical protein